MAIDYVKSAAIANRLISENGIDVTVGKLNRTPFESDKPWRGSNPAGDTRVTVKAVLLDYNENDIDGELVKRGDRRALVAFSSTAEELRDFDFLEEGNGEVWNVIAVNVLQPAATGILYTLQLRR